MNKLFTIQGVVTAANDYSYFIQDGSGAWNGIYIYDNTNLPAVGDDVILQGEVSEYYNLTELSNITYFATVSSGNELPAAVELGTGFIGTSGEPYEGCRVKISNAACTNPDLGFGDAYFDDGTGDCMVDDMLYDPDPDWVTGEYYSITGVLQYTYEEYKIEPSSADDVSIGNNNFGEGCTNSLACNYAPDATEDDGSCIYPEEGYTCDGACINDSNGDGICDSFCQEDLNSDGYITIQDLLLILSEFGCTSSCENDINQDGYVAVDDLLLVLSEFGNTCYISGIQNCGEPVSHEGYDYSTVQIGDQCWFSENCRYLPDVSPSGSWSETDPYYYVYDYQGTDVTSAQATYNYETYGVLYNWPAVMTEGICPSGWHIPSDGEFIELIDFLGGQVFAGYVMKSTSGWSSGGNGSNSSGFNGLPGGGGHSSDFLNLHYTGVWWSASESGSYSWNHQLNFLVDNVGRTSTERGYGYSTRCVQD